VTNRLDLVVNTAEGVPVVGWQELVLLVDGVDVFGEVWDGMGRDPDELLGPESPLVPSAEPRDVVIQRCGCGYEGCDRLITTVRREGDEVVWNDFREHSSTGPSVAGLNEFRFDASQYLRTLEQADRDRPWESEDRLTARLIREQIRVTGRPLSARGWHFVYASAGVVEWLGRTATDGATVRDGVSVTLENGERQIGLSFPAIDDAPPVERASRIVEALFEGDPSNWPVSFKGGELSAWPEEERRELGPGPHVLRFRG
jgi:hypothetical protein